MGNFEEVVAVHYGNWTLPGRNEPSFVREDIYPGLHDYAEYLRKEFDLGMVLTHRRSPVDADGRRPIVGVVNNPEFEILEDGSSQVVDVSTVAADLEDYPLVVDRDVDNFHGNLKPHGERIARGLGLATKYTLNSPGMQQLGNDKTLFRREVAEPLGIAAPVFSLNVEGINAFYERYGDVRLITKPHDSAIAEGIKELGSLSDLMDALKRGEVSPSHMLEPFADQSQPIEGLRAYYPEDQGKLDASNADTSRVKEVRWHYGAHTDNEGNVHPWAYPTYRVGPSGLTIMGRSDSLFLPLDQESVPADLYETVMRGIPVAMKAAGVPHLYGSFDFKSAVMPNGEREWQCGDGNCRSPYMPPSSTQARTAYMNMWGLIARHNIDAGR